MKNIIDEPARRKQFGHWAAVVVLLVAPVLTRAPSVLRAFIRPKFRPGSSLYRLATLMMSLFALPKVDFSKWPSLALKEIGKRLVVGYCIIGLILPAGSQVAVAESIAALGKSDHSPSTPNAKPPTPLVKINRTVPRVEPPKTSLQLSASPTVEEIFRARLFEEPLVPIGATPTAAENAALAVALLAYSKRAGPDDFSSLTAFLEKHPKSPWRAALLINLGLEYYNTAHYSLTLPAWSEAWTLAKDATELKAKAVADRAVGEVAYMFARLGRTAELDALLKSVQGRVFNGPAQDRISGAREGLWTMQNYPGIAFRCGPFALQRIRLSLDPKNAGGDLIHDSASTQNGFSLPQVVALSQKLGMNYQMAFRDKDAAVVVPSVAHWKIGHYAAIVRQEGGRYLVQDPTFRNDAWITREALETEVSGYFAVPPGDLLPGWRPVQANEGSSIWGKGTVDGPCAGCGRPPNPPGPCNGMAVPSVDLLFVSLGLSDEPVGYSPPVGPAVRFMVRYNQRDAFQPANFTYSNFGAKWTFDWLSYIKDDPSNPAAGVQYYQMGGFIRNFDGFDGATQSYAFQLLDQTKLTRTSPTSYEMASRDGSKLIFGQSDGSSGTSRKIFLKQIINPAGQAVSLTYDVNLRIVAVADAIGQVTTLAYELPTDIYKITKVTDPFGRFATFDYDASGRLTKITDVIGLTSQFTYDGASDFINALTTPYGTTAFTKGESGTTRSLETLYPDGNRERVEFNQSPNLGIPNSDAPMSVPTGMRTRNEYLFARNTYFWSKIATAAAYGDYTKAKIYHWLHTADGASASRILESEKEPLEGRIWYDYAGQSSPLADGTTSKPSHSGRVLDDGSTQLYTYEYNGFGNVTKTIDPVGRTFSSTYAGNGQDLLETRMTRNGASELLTKTIYDTQHLPLITTDAAGQKTTYTYNVRGQILTVENAKGEVTTYLYDANGYRISADGPLPGSSDTETWTYDVAGRVRTRTNESGYSLTFNHDSLDRLTNITFPDGTYHQFTYTRLDQTQLRDRAGRITSFEYDGVRNMRKRTDTLNRATLYQWCKCGDLKSLTDPMGRTTVWSHDVQGRVTRKTFPDGSATAYFYENTTSRLARRVDEKSQVTTYTYLRDDALGGISYANALVGTPAVTFAYDQDYARVTSMTDGTGTTLYGYLPATGGPSPGANELGSVDGPLPNDTITYGYDELGRRVTTAIAGVASTLSFDAAGRLTGENNALGSFTYGYDGASLRRVSQTHPNGQSTQWAYGTGLEDHSLMRITNKRGAAAVSEFLYTRDIPHFGRVASWSQQVATANPGTYSFGYDEADQLTSASVTSGGPGSSLTYSYDPSGNRLTETLDGTTAAASYNTLNELTSVSRGAGDPVTNEWNSEHRLAAVNAGNARTEFTYDGLGHLTGIRKLVSGAEVSNRRMIWCNGQICEERSANGTVNKRFFEQGVKFETGPSAGLYFYTRDHLQSVREMTDHTGAVRARYSYDPFGRRSRETGDLEADFGFAGMFWAKEAALAITPFRAYDPAIARWLSRDPLPDAEVKEGPNLYAYVLNNPLNLTDPLGLCCEDKKAALEAAEAEAKTAVAQAQTVYEKFCNAKTRRVSPAECKRIKDKTNIVIQNQKEFVTQAAERYLECLSAPCSPCPPGK
jgi:RHS repeat-associated protein